LSREILFAAYPEKNTKRNQNGEIFIMPIKRLLKQLLRKMAGETVTMGIGYILELY